MSSTTIRPPSEVKKVSSPRFPFFGSDAPAYSSLTSDLSLFAVFCHFSAISGKGGFRSLAEVSFPRPARFVLVTDPIALGTG